MDLVRHALLAIALAAATPAHAGSVERWRPHVAEASARFGSPESWVWRVMRAESGGRTHIRGRPIRSRKGAMGLMQLMPGTWSELRRKHGLGADPDDPRDNILAGTAYLREMYDRFGYPGLFAAYNAGPARYSAYLARRQALPGETVGYLAAVAGTSPGVAPARGPVVVGPAASNAPAFDRSEPAWRSLFLPLSRQGVTQQPE
jgi:soluble lytic murein transglycosylase-like protein